jgi:hypothetical protein
MVKSGNMDGSSVEFKHHCAQINLIVSSLNPHVCWVYGSYMKLLVLSENRAHQRIYAA